MKIKRLFCRKAYYEKTKRIYDALVSQGAEVGDAQKKVAILNNAEVFRTTTLEAVHRAIIRRKRAVYATTAATARNDDPQSPTSSELEEKEEASGGGASAKDGSGQQKSVLPWFEEEDLVSAFLDGSRYVAKVEEWTGKATEKGTMVTLKWCDGQPVRSNGRGAPP